MRSCKIIQSNALLRFVNSVQNRLPDLTPCVASFICVGEWFAYSAGGNFTPHIVTIAAGEVIYFYLKFITG